MYGFAGTILRINLTREEITKQPLPKLWAAKFLGGSGINDWILYNEVKPDATPLSPDNKLIFGVGPLAGVLPLGSKARITSRSPLTGIFGDSSSGGFWPVQLKYAGYDHIIVEGKAKEPCYVWIDDDHVEIRKAGDLWGRDVFEADDIIRDELGDKGICTATIGPAGENLVKYASIQFDRYRAAGRTGTGCVMGSKKLKAIAVRGTKAIKIAMLKETEKYICELLERLDPRKNETLARFSKYGTLGTIPFYNELGSLSVRNYQDVCYDKIDQIDPDLFMKKYYVRNTSCSPNCVLHCSHWWRIRDGPFAGEAGEKPELTTTMAYGPHLDNPRWDAICYLQNLANKLGIDVVESGMSIGVLMELWEKGAITEEDTDGIRYEWGSVDAIVESLRKIAYREGIGNLIAEGALNLAKKIGGIETVCHSKGMTMSGEVRPFVHWALAFAVSSRGADHLKGYSYMDKSGRTDISKALFGDPGAGMPHDIRLKGIAVKYTEELFAMFDALGICKLQGGRLLVPEDPADMMTIESYAPMYSAVTGISLTPKEFGKCCERIVILEKSYNARIGIGRKDDTLSGRWMREPCPSGGGKGMKCEDYLDVCLDEYYKARGFDLKSGRPKRDKLEELGLGEIADELESLCKLGGS